MHEAIEEMQRVDEQKALSGFVELDNLMSGFGRGELIITAVRQQWEKTTFAMNAIYNAASHLNCRGW